MNTLDSAPIRLWQLISPTLPVGAFTWSQGLEYAVEAGWVHDETAARDWIGGLARNVIARLDLPVINRSWCAWEGGDGCAALAWNRRLLASRETGELLSEDQTMGSALRRLTMNLGLAPPRELREPEPVSFAAMFAWLCHHWRIDRPQALSGYLWAWCENQTTAAIKLIPLGQTAGQRLLLALGGHIPGTVEQSMDMPDEDIGMTAQGMGIASACHETQYTRLFRS